MPKPNTPFVKAEAVPRWLVLLGSLAIVFHLVAVVVAALAVPSGPWPGMGGSSLAMPPQFAFTTNNFTSSAYLKWIKLNHSYRFNSIRPGQPEAYLEAKLKDENGKEISTVRFPDPAANTWVRYRQSVLVRSLTEDLPFMSDRSEPVAAPGQEPPSVEIWSPVDPRNPKNPPNAQRLWLNKVAEHLLPRNETVYRPNDWSLVLVRSYARYLCRTQGAASVELIRHSKEAIPPAVLFMDSFQPGAFQELVCNYGEFKR